MTVAIQQQSKQAQAQHFVTLTKDQRDLHGKLLLAVGTQQQLSDTYKEQLWQ
jgi:hypothetical protein